jgi:hypothetical protein
MQIQTAEALHENRPVRSLHEQTRLTPGETRMNQ